jgi:hypothetical protein
MFQELIDHTIFQQEQSAKACKIYAPKKYLDSSLGTFSFLSVMESHNDMHAENVVFDQGEVI